MVFCNFSGDVRDLHMHFDSPWAVRVYPKEKSPYFSYQLRYVVLTFGLNLDAAGNGNTEEYPSGSSEPRTAFPVRINLIEQSNVCCCLLTIKLTLCHVLAVRKV